MKTYCSATQDVIRWIRCFRVCTMLTTRKLMRVVRHMFAQVDSNVRVDKVKWKKLISTNLRNFFLVEKTIYSNREKRTKFERKHFGGKCRGASSSKSALKLLPSKHVLLLPEVAFMLRSLCRFMPLIVTSFSENCDDFSRLSAADATRRLSKAVSRQTEN